MLFWCTMTGAAERASGSTGMFLCLDSAGTLNWNSDGQDQEQDGQTRTRGPRYLNRSASGPSHVSLSSMEKFFDFKGRPESSSPRSQHEVPDESGLNYDSPKRDRSIECGMNFKTGRESLEERVALQSSKLLNDQQYHSHLDIKWQLLRMEFFNYAQKELERLWRVLNPNDPDPPETEEEMKWRDTREEFLKITVHLLRITEGEDLAERLWSRSRAAQCGPQLKQRLQKKFSSVSEGVAKAGNTVPLNQIFTDLYITEGGTDLVNQEHEVRLIETAARKVFTPETTIRQEDLFRSSSDRDRPIRSLLTNGVAGIGKTLLTQKLALDWAEDKAHQNFHFMFPFTFRELNTLKEKKLSLVELVHLFFPETKESGISSFEGVQVLFIFDGLDECRLPLDFINNRVLTEATESTSVDVLLTNLIRGNLLPSAHLWVTTRPAAANQIPPECVDMVTEVRGFTDLQKEEYFRKRFRDEEQTTILSHIRSSRSLYIMCHIPIFCWITATVLEDMLKSRETSDLPKTLTEMYIHFLVVQVKLKRMKFDGGTGTEKVWTIESRKMIKSLAKLAFEQLERGNLICYESDLTECGIDITAASVYSGVFTQIFREETGLYQDKVFCFVHLSLQEFLAALHVHLTFTNSGVNLLESGRKYFAFLALALKRKNHFYQTAVEQMLKSPNGQLDLFLRFLLGLSLKTNQTLLRGLLSQTVNESWTSKATAAFIKNKISEDLSPERTINLFHCLNELKDGSLVEEVQQQLRSGRLSTDQLSSAQWSALAFVLLSSEEHLEVFDLNKYSASEEVFLRLLPVVRASNKVLLKRCELTERSCQTLSSVLSSPTSSVTHLDLSDNDLQDSGVKLLCAGLESPHCHLETLSLSGCLISEEGCASLASALSSNPSHLRELDLSYNHPVGPGVEQLSAGVESPDWRLETLRLDYGGEQRLRSGMLKYFDSLTGPKHSTPARPTVHQQQDGGLWDRTSRLIVRTLPALSVGSQMNKSTRPELRDRSCSQNLLDMDLDTDLHLAPAVCPRVRWKNILTSGGDESLQVRAWTISGQSFVMVMNINHICTQNGRLSPIFILHDFFQLLVQQLSRYMQKELNRVWRVLTPDDPQPPETEEEKQWVSIREEFLKITVHLLRIMEEEDLAERLWSRGCVAECGPRMKKRLQMKFHSVSEGVAKAGNTVPLNQIYTELYITEGGTDQVNQEHEVRQIETVSRKVFRPETTIRQEDLFRSLPDRDRPIRSLLTKGVAGIGKTLLTQKLTLDWAEDKAHQNFHFIFPFTFRELNTLKEKKLSLVELVHLFFPETKEFRLSSFEGVQVLFIFDGLDECRLPLDFINNRVLTEATESTSVDVLLTNLIRGNLLPSAHLWVTTRPAAANQIPPECVDMVTEVRGFTDLQKEEYFRKRFRVEEQTTILSHIRSSRSLYIMCHIPIFCWITATVLEDMLKSREAKELPKTLTEMYIHFLVVQTKVKQVKFDGGTGTDPHWTPESRKMIESLGKLAFEQLQKGNLIFYESDLTGCDIDITAASVYSGVFTQNFSEDTGLYQDKVFCFVHLSVQEFMAALHVHLTFINSGLNLLCPQEPTQSEVKLGLEEFYQTVVLQTLRSPNGHLDLFLRFLLGLSLKTNQFLLRGLLRQTECESQNNTITAELIKKKINEDMSPERTINLFHCLNELKDSSLVEEVQKQLRSGRLSADHLSPAQWSALSFILLSTEEQLDVFDLNKYSASEKVFLRLLPVIGSSNKVLLGRCGLTERSCPPLSSVLSSPSSSVTQLDLSDNDLQDSGVKLLCAGLESPHCHLETLSLSGCMISEEGCASLASALSSNPSHLRELDLSYNHPGGPGLELLSAGLERPDWRLETLRLDHGGEQRLRPGLHKYFCPLTLDPNTAHQRLLLSNNNRTVEIVTEHQNYPEHPDRFNKCPQLMCTNVLTGRCYWEVEWSGEIHISVTYRRNRGEDECWFGDDDQSWSLVCSDEGYHVRHDGKFRKIHSSSASERVGVFVDCPAGSVSFYSVSSDALVHLHTFFTTFTQTLYTGFVLWSWSGSSVTLCDRIQFSDV
ncbi:uncharacterized protein ACB058_020182 [Synchiropus picturatus]